MKFKIFLMISVVLSAFLISCNNDEETEIGNWVGKAYFEGFPRGEGTSFAINGKGYFGMGKDDDGYLTDFWMYDPAKDAWTQVQDFPGTPRAYNVSIASNTKGYVGLGYDGDNDLADFWEYDAAADQWTKIVDFEGGARKYATAFAIGDDIYVGTGTSSDDKIFNNDFFKYSGGQWTKITSLSGEKRKKANAVGLNGKGYLISGYRSSLLSDFWSYDPTTDKWTKLTSLTDADTGDTGIPRSNANTFVSEGKIYIAAGNISGATSNTVFEWDPSTLIWTKKTSIESGSVLGTNREGAGCFVISDKAYIVGGHTGSAYNDDCYLFEPSLEKNSDD